VADKSIIIIGAGISGLSAGCYAQINGYHTRIFEMHRKPGGLCTYWKRKGYTIGTPGWLMGSRPANNDYYQFWQELGALPGRKTIDYEEYARFVGSDGQVFVLYTDIDRLEQHMKELAPEDEDLIADFAKALRAFTRLKMPADKPPELGGPLAGLKMMLRLLPYMGIMGKWMGKSLRDFANQFKNPFLREVLGEAAPMVFFDPDVSIMFVLGTLAFMHLKAAGYLVGGPAEFVNAIEQRYIGLGGEIHYRSRVTEILVEPDPSGRGDRAIGVRLEDGSEHRADIVISAADGRTTVFELLGGKYVSEDVQSYYDTLPLFPPITFISLGVDRTFDDVPPSAGGELFRLDEPVTIAGREWKWMVAHVYGFDPSLAPEGKTLIRVIFATDYASWKDLREDRDRYKAEKDRVADQVIALLERRYPGLADQVEMIDVATPVTFERYTGNWKGSWLGWLSTAKTMNMRMSKTLPGLDSFYQVGTWVLGSSLPAAATSGRHVVQILCDKDKKPFRAPVP
jgi:phytoene dehydrogenase-like protein